MAKLEKKYSLLKICTMINVFRLLSAPLVRSFSSNIYKIKFVNQMHILKKLLNILQGGTLCGNS